MKQRIFNAILAVLVAVALVLGTLGLSRPQPPASVVKTIDPTEAGAQEIGDVWAIDYFGTELAAIDASGNFESAGNYTLENDETISNATDGVVQVGGNLAVSEGAVITVANDVSFTVAGSFQPLVSAAAITGTLIADGSVAGQIVILTNENASDNIVIAESGSNLAAGGDITLAGGNDDAVILVWTGDEWIKAAAFGDN